MLNVHVRWIEIKPLYFCVQSTYLGVERIKNIAVAWPHRARILSIETNSYYFVLQSRLQQARLLRANASDASAVVVDEKTGVKFPATLTSWYESLGPTFFM